MDHQINQTSSSPQHGGYGVIEDVDSVTDCVVRAMSRAPNARLRAIMESFVRHLHAFVREVRLTEAEYDVAIDFLNRIGKATNDTHNEGILFADAVGFSTLACLLNNGLHGAPQTAAALLGPFWRDNAPFTPNGGSIVRSPTPGPALFVTGMSATRTVGRSPRWKSMSGIPRRSGSTKTRIRTKPR